jgi:O-methyltransferase involved in polyketide biosynthesis
MDHAAPTNPISATSRWMAAARARESERTDRLFDDPLAAALAGPQGFAWLERMETAARSDGPGTYPVIRTRFFDDFLLDACRRLGVGQVVLA